MSAALREFFEVYGADPRCLVPLGVYVDGLILAQGLTPADPLTGNVEDGLQRQVGTCFERMRLLVEQAGASLDNVARAVCYVLDADDREPVYQAWDSLFPHPADRPAFKVLTGPLPAGHRVRLDVLAVSGQRRRRIDIPRVEARDPTVVAGSWLFTSRLHAIDPATGKSVDGLGEQVHQGVANARKLNELAGSGFQFTQLTTFGRDAAYVEPARASLTAATSIDAPAPALNVLQSWVRPGTDAMVEAIAAAPEAGQGVRRLRELFLDPNRANQADGFQLDDFVFGGWLTAGRDATADTEAQLRGCLTNMDRLLARAGCSRGEVARVSFYMRDLAERPVLNQVWQEWFPDPDDRPPHTYLPAALPDGCRVALQVIAVAGSRRRVLTVPGVEHGDPMSLAAVSGNLLTTSRIFGRAAGSGPEHLEEHTADCFQTAATLLAAAGGARLQQLTTFVSSPDFEAAVAGRLGLLPGDDRTRLEVLHTDLGRRILLPRLQLIALVDPDGKPSDGEKGKGT